MKYQALFGFIFLLQVAFSQTNVSGGIFQNTTWTAAGSPYLVTGSIVVFPGKTLTLETGVKVVFTADNTFNTGNFQYLGLSGEVLQTMHLEPGENTVQIHVNTGIYFLRDQNGSTKRLFL
jgi:hypothetical protein